LPGGEELAFVIEEIAVRDALSIVPASRASVVGRWRSPNSTVVDGVLTPDAGDDDGVVHLSRRKARALLDEHHEGKAATIGTIRRQSARCDQLVANRQPSQRDHLVSSGLDDLRRQFENSCRAHSQRPLFLHGPLH